MKREWILLAGTVVVTLGLALGVIRWLAPQLLGIPVDLQLVRSSKTVPPFYDGVFRAEDYTKGDILIPDPVTVTRLRPRLMENRLTGPHDILGFRNDAVPSIADVVTLGDSQTYGNNALPEHTWPRVLERRLSDKRATVYSMAAAGWGPIQYLHMASLATSFQTQLIVVAFYSGNDPLDAFAVAYASDDWADLRGDPALDASDAPRITFPAPVEEHWKVTFRNGQETVFTPRLRLYANDDTPVVRAGYATMAKVAAEITAMVKPHGTRVLFTVIPTKELAYAKRIERETIAPSPDYARLVELEGRYIGELVDRLRAMPGTHYVDLVAPLQKAAMTEPWLYPHNADGHPMTRGYALIAERIAAAAQSLVQPRPLGLYFANFGEKDTRLVLSTPSGIWYFPSHELAIANGWRLEGLPTVGQRAFAGLPRLGLIETVDPARFGPDAASAHAPSTTGEAADDVRG